MKSETRQRRLAAISLGLAAMLAIAPSTQAQTFAEAAAKSAASDYKAPRTTYGQPDLRGIWNQNYLIMLESPDGVPLILSEEEARGYWLQTTDALAEGYDRGLDPELGSIAKATTGMPLIHGKRRSRTVVLPEDGRIPYTARGLELHEGGAIKPIYGSYEDRPGWERSLMGLGLPPIPNVGLGEDNPREIFQTKDHIVIHTEYGSEARIIPFADEHHPTPIHGVLGDAIARWEGETLVIETIGVSDFERVRTISNLVVTSDSKVIERYTRIGEDEVLYQYTVEDPAIYSQPWQAEYSLFISDHRLYEGSCHEGNYAVPNILNDARMEEMRERAAAKE